MYKIRKARNKKRYNLKKIKDDGSTVNLEYFETREEALLKMSEIMNKLNNIKIEKNQDQPQTVDEDTEIEDV